MIKEKKIIKEMVKEKIIIVVLYLALKIHSQLSA